MFYEGFIYNLLHRSDNFNRFVGLAASSHSRRRRRVPSPGIGCAGWGHPVYRLLFVVIMLLVALAANSVPAPQEVTADLLVVGGTESGCAAAVQAARMGGTNIVLVNDIEWLGGQFSAEALCAVDENREGSYDGTVPIPRSGLFREVIDRIELINSNKFAGVSCPGNTRVITTCLPSDAELAFRDLLEPYETQGDITRYSGYYPTQAIVNVDGVTLEGVVFAPVDPEGTSLVVHASVTIDASDWGDAIRLSGAEYTFGPDLQSDYGEPSAPTSRGDFPLTDMNPVTYCQIVIEQTNNTPIPMPAGYDVRNFTVGSWKSLGFSHAYTSRRLVDHYEYPQIDHPDVILLNNPHVDYPLLPLSENVVFALETLEPGASSKNIVEMTRAQRQVLFEDAKQRSLSYLYYLQTIIHSNLVDKTHSFLRFALSEEFGTPDNLPPKPYVRESLRLKADYVVRQQDSFGWSTTGVPDERAFARMMFHDAVMCWQFEYDFHPTRRTFSDGGDPGGPWYASFAGNRNFGNGGSGKAVFPLRALIPESVDGLLGAQKNLGYTSIVSSSLRLHDQSMAVGQAAGAAAAVALDHGVPVRDLPWDAGLMADVWDGLLSDAGVAMPAAIWPFKDVLPEHDAFPAVNQLAVRGLLPEGPYDTSFHADESPESDWVLELTNRVVAAGYTLLPATLNPLPATRGEVAVVLWNKLDPQQDPAWVRLSANDADLDGVLDKDDPLPFNTNTEYWAVSVSAVEDGLPPEGVSLNESWRGFNFKQSGASSWSPYQDDSGERYTEERGYGWLADLSANTRLRGVYPESIRDSFVFTRYQDIWQCAVSNGTYDVYFCVGDSGYDQPDQNIAVEGVPVLSSVDTYAGFFCEGNVTVTVIDGFLTVIAGRPEGGVNTTLNWIYFSAHEDVIEVPPEDELTQPDELDGLVFWVKADTGITTNAEGCVTAWSDNSSRGNDVSAANLIAPALVLSEPSLNNQPTVRFDGSAQRLSVANRILTNGIEGCTIIAMAKADINDNPSIIGIRTAGGTPFVQLDQDAGGHPRFIVRNSSGATANALSAQVHTGTYGMYAGRLSKGNGTQWSDQVYFSNPSPEASASADFGGNTDLTSGYQSIGAVSTGSTTYRYWDGDVAEIMIYERALSENELAAIENYLASRYRASGYNPPTEVLKNIDGLELWLRGDSSVYKDLFAIDEVEPGDAVRLWCDVTSGEHDAVALSTPTFMTNMANGLPALGFSPGGSDRFYLNDNPITTNLSQLVVFAVFRQIPGDTEQNMIFTHRNSATPLLQASFNDGVNAVLQMRGGSGIGGVQMITAPGLLTNGTFNVVMYQFDAVNDRHAVAVNGGPEFVNTYDFGSQTFVADTQRIGCYNAGGGDGFFLHGYLAELLVFEGVSLSADQKNMVGYYLQHKYGLDTGYFSVSTRMLVR